MNSSPLSALETTAAAVAVTLASHERRISYLETIDRWSVRAILFLATLKFFGIDNLGSLVSIFTGIAGIAQHHQ